MIPEKIPRDGLLLTAALSVNREEVAQGRSGSYHVLAQSLEKRRQAASVRVLPPILSGINTSCISNLKR